jgi:uroporphyrinogen III methyltransferase/synthase
MNARPLIVLAAHGGGEGSSANLLVASLAAQLCREFPHADVAPSFNLGHPDLASAVHAALGRRIVVVPLMTSAGYFAGEHLRRSIAQTGVDPRSVEIAPPIGVDRRVAELACTRFGEALARHRLDPGECSLLVIGHGTARSSASGAATDAIVAEVQRRFNSTQARAAFLDQAPYLENVAADPSLRSVVVAFPFLIGGAGHAREDVPDRLGVPRAAAETQQRSVRADGRSVLVLPPLGEDPSFPAILSACIEAALARRPLRIGTRASRLAMWQCGAARDALARAGFATEVVTIDTEGDRDRTRHLDSFATDGPFTDALEAALLSGAIDVAVHSCKDLPLALTAGTEIGAALPRGSAGDALVSFDGSTLDALPRGARIGTCSQRRAAQLARLRPDVTAVPIRGTVDERLEQVARGLFHGVILSVAGLERLGRSDAVAERLRLDDMMPEAGQGAIVLQTRESDATLRPALAAIDDQPTRLAILAERACSKLITEQTGLIAAAIATTGDEIELRGRAISDDGRIVVDAVRRGSDPAELARAVADEIVRALDAPAGRAIVQREPHRSAGSVALVGAGPGDPGLLTLRGLRLLREADVVLFDRLLDQTLLDEAPPHARRIDVGKAPGQHTLSQEEINGLLVEHAAQGRRVVRLKGGDPFIFGRGFEEARHCLAHGVPCEVVPGVTSAIAAPASAGIPVTARGVARTFAIATPQTGSGQEKTALDYGALARIDTVSFLMARAEVDAIARGLIAAGRASTTPAAVVQDGTLPTQRHALGTLDTIATEAEQAGLRAPAVFVVGESAAHAMLDDGAPRGPLHGSRIVVTRPASASPGLVALLRAHGATVVHCPLIRVVPRRPHDLSALAHRHRWVVFTSLHAVRGYWRLLRDLGRDARAFAQASVAAVGPKTADELHAIGITPDLVPPVYRAAGLIDAIAAGNREGTHRVLFPCGTLARDELRDGLRARGFVVDELVVYDTLLQQPPPESLHEARSGTDALLLYSPSAAESAARAGLLRNGLVIACIGPTTAARVRELGFEPEVVASDHSDAGLVAALGAFFAGRAHADAAREGAIPC